MADLAEATGASGRMAVYLADESGAEEEFVVRELSLRYAGMLEAWLKKQPRQKAVDRARLAVEGLPPEQQRDIIEAALAEDRAWPPRIDVQPGAALLALFSAEGGRDEVVLRVLQQAKPQMPEKKLREFAAGISLTTFDRMRSIAFGADSRLTVTQSSSEFVLLDPSGMERLVRGVADSLTAPAAEGDEAPRAIDAKAIEDTIQAVRAMTPGFGTVIKVDCEGDAPAVPKGVVSATPAPPAS